MRLPSEKPKSNAIETGYFAMHLQMTGKWVGVYHSPQIGVKYVRNKSGKFEVFDTKEAAEKRSLTVLLATLNADREPLKVTREIKVGRGQSGRPKSHMQNLSRLR
jgi:hypothetical protein